MSNVIKIELGEVQDLVVVKASFDKDQSVTVNFAAQMTNGPADVTINMGVPWHPDFREAVKLLDVHVARLAGQLGPHAELDESDWTGEMLEWWEETRLRFRVISITWAGQDRSKIKIVAEVWLKTGYTLLQPPLIDLERSKYEFLPEFETCIGKVREELVQYIAGKSAIGRQTSIFDAVVEPRREDEAPEEEDGMMKHIHSLPASTAPTSPELFRAAIEAALKQQPVKPKLKKGELSNVSEHMRLWCIANGAFLPDAVFNIDAFANDIARGIVEALKEVKAEDKALPYVVELRATTEPGSTLKWRELFNVMQPEIAGVLDNNDLALACVAFCRLMIKLSIAPFQQWHSPLLFAEHLAEVCSHSRDIPQSIANTVEAYQHNINRNE